MATGLGSGDFTGVAVLATGVALAGEALACVELVSAAGRTVGVAADRVPEVVVAADLAGRAE